MLQLGLFATEGPPRFDTQPGIPIYRVTLVKDGRMPYGQVRSSTDASGILTQYLASVDREHFIVLLLDRKNKVIGIDPVSIGSLTASIAHPREVFKAAILANTAAIVLGHNHPSGDPQPSKEDRAITTRLVEGGKLLGIEVLDHVIIGDGQHYSFADEGAL